MGSNRRNKGKSQGTNRDWDEWQRYVRKETQRLKQKSSGNVVHVKFAPKQQPQPPSEIQSDTSGETPRQVPHDESRARSAPIDGVTREEALQVSDDHIGRTVKPFTVDDYRRIRPMNLMGGERGEADPAVEELQSNVKASAVADSQAAVLDKPVEEKAPKGREKGKGRKKGKKGKSETEELELFGSVSDHQVMARQRLARKNKLDREELIEKLLDPVISLDEAATLIGVCKTTVRRYTNRGELECLRTPGQQRRFKLSQVLEFVKKRENDQKSRQSKRSNKTE